MKQSTVVVAGELVYRCDELKAARDDLPKLLAQIIERRQLTGKTAAAQIGVTGFTLSRILSGHAVPTDDALEAIRRWAMAKYKRKDT